MRARGGVWKIGLGGGGGSGVRRGVGQVGLKGWVSLVCGRGGGGGGMVVVVWGGRSLDWIWVERSGLGKGG